MAESDASLEELLTGMIGKPTGRSKVVVERGPVSLFASWTAHIPQLQHHLGLSDGRLGLALLGAPIGSVLAMVVAARLLPIVGSPAMVRLALVGYCVSGPFIGLTGSLGTFFVALVLWGFFQGDA